MSEKPTYEELEKRIQELEEAELKSHHHYLEELVKNRTTKLLEANEQLKREIKERKQLEKSLKESEAQLRLITDNLPIIISHIDRDLKYLFVNKFYYDRSKLSINIIGKNVIDVIGEEAFNRALPYMKKTLSSGEPISFINRSTHTKNNKLIIFETNYIPSVVNGKVESFFVLGMDITERKLAEEALQEKQAQLQAIVDYSPALISIKDLEGTVILASRNFELLDIPPLEEFIGKNVFELFSKEVAEDLWQNDLMAIEAGRPIDAEETVTHRDGTLHTYLTVKFPLLDAKRNAFGVCAISTDITERKKAEAENVKLNERLHQSNKMESIGTLAGGIAHDFNNILSAVLGFTELALDAVDKETTIAEDLQEVYTAGLRAKDLVLQILTFARQSDEKLKPIQVGFIIKEVLKFIRSSIPTTIEIKQDIKSESFIMASSTQLHRIMMNLCTNASQAMENEGGTLEITLNDMNFARATNIGTLSVKPGNYVEIKVSDTGDGINPQVIEKIFEPYFTTKVPGEGTGMGLAMVHGIVETYGGEILVESTPGQGTVFTIYLPTAKNSKVHLHYKAEELPTGQERILFVDDEVQIAKMASRVLDQLGYSVTTKTDSLEALELFRSKPNDFDLVISDVTMPKMAGDQLTTELFQIRPDIPVILCTGYSKRLSEEKATEIGIKAFAYKPIVKEDLAKTVRKVLDEAKNNAIES